MSNTIILNQIDLERLLSLKVISPNTEETAIKDLLKSGPVVMNFILGTWCPMCLGHLKGITAALKSNNATVVIVSSEPLMKLESEFKRHENWSELESIPYALYSDSSRELINLFQLRIPVFGFSKPATFLIQNSNTVQIISKGIPNSEKTICELGKYAKLS